MWVEASRQDWQAQFVVVGVALLIDWIAGMKRANGMWIVDGMEVDA